MQAMIETERLLLRPLDGGDAARMAELCGDLAVSRWLARVPHPYALADAERFLASLPGGTERAWAVCPKGESALAGVVGLASEADGLHLGYWLGRAYWGRGWMSEAARAVTAAAFGSGVGALVSGAFDDNHASLAIQRKLGFRDAGKKRLYCLALDGERGHTMTRLTHADWEVAA